MVISSRLIWSLSEIIFNAIEIGFVYSFFMNKLAEKESHIIRPVVGGICLLIYISVLNNIAVIDGITMTILFYFGTMTYAVGAFKGNIIKKIFTGIFPIVVVINSDFFTFAISIMLDIFSDRAWEPTYERFVMNFIYIGFTILLYYLINMFYQNIWQITNQPALSTVFILILMVLGIFVINFLIAIATQLTFLEYDTRDLKLYIIFIGIVFLIIFSSCIFFFSKWSLAIAKNQEIEMQNQYRKLKEEYYNNIYNSLENLEYFRHDIMKHFQIIGILLTSNSSEKALDYLTNLHCQYSKLLEISNYTNDDVLNAILSNKKSIARKCGIKMRITTEKIGVPPLTSYELCSLFDNLLDNAIEACKKMEIDKFIDVFITFVERHMCIIVKNSYSGELFVKDGMFMTTKKDKINHGFGMKIVNSIVSNAGGHSKIEIDENETVFTVTILLPISS